MLNQRAVFFSMSRKVIICVKLHGFMNQKVRHISTSGMGKCRTTKNSIKDPPFHFVSTQDHSY